jgi:gamma-glutamyltranspeptidase / glutathione hydrolase
MNRLNNDETYNNDAYNSPAQTDQWVENRAVWRQFLDAGETARIGSLVKDPGSANTVRIMMEAEQKALAAGASREEAIRAARDEFYKGQIARDFAAFIQENGGLHTYEDFANYSARWYDQDELHHTTYMGYDIWTEQTYTQSAMYIILFNMIKNFDLYEIGYMTPTYINLLSQMYALVIQDRWQYFGDPDFVDVPEGLWTQEYADLRAGLIDLERGPFDWLPPPGDPINMKAVLEGWEAPAELLAYGPHGTPEGMSWGSIDIDELTALHDLKAGGSMDTTSFTIADTKGNMLNYCPSDGRSGSVPMLPGYGFGISMRARQFTLIEGHPGSIEPGKRPVSTPHTSLITKDGQPYMALSSVSGDEQVQGLFMIMLSNIVWGMSPQVAIEQPKLVQNNILSHFTPHFTSHNPTRLRLELDDMPAETVAALEALGWAVERRANWSTVGTSVMVVFNPDLGTVVGGSNVRGHNYSVGH